MTYPIHSPATFAYRDHPLEIQAFLRDDRASVVALYLVYPHNGAEKRVRMLPVDGFAAQESYSLYQGVLPAAALANESVEYAFELDGKRGAHYRVPLHTRKAPPPLVLTELCFRMPKSGAYYEIFNPAQRAVDLYDYEILLELNGKLVGRNAFCEEPLEMILEAGECAAVRFLDAEYLNKIRDFSLDMPLFLDTLAQYFPDTCEELSEHPPRVFLSPCALINENGTWIDDPTSFAKPNWQSQRYHLVRRGTNTPLYTLSANCGVKYDDVPQHASSLWSVDPLDPAKAIKTATRRAGTPAAADVAQALPRFDDFSVPALLPLQQCAISFAASTPCIGFAVLGGAHDAPVLFYRDGEAWQSAVCEMDESGLWQAMLSREFVRRQKKEISYYIECKGAWYTARLGSEINPLTVSVLDDAGPEIIALYPAQGQDVEKEEQPLIHARFFDVAGVDLAASAICLDGLNVSEEAIWSESEVTYRPAKPIAMGEHVLELVLRDKIGNRTYHRTVFCLHDATQMRLFTGQVHSHTRYSDGTGSPADAMRYARDVGKVDFFSVSDHCFMTAKDGMENRRARADVLNENGKFATLFGFEMTWLTDGFWGHMNLLNTDWYDCSRATALPDFYKKIAADENAVAMFNHPEYRWGDFDSFRYHSKAVDDRVCLAEIREAKYDNAYALMLSRGWHAAPVWNEDNHKPDWTTATKGAGVVLAHTLTRENVLDAMRRRRTYSTSDRSTKVLYRVNGEWLGARLKAPDTLSFEVLVSTESEAGIGDLYLVAEDNIVVAHTQAGTLKQFSWRLKLPAEFDYYYLKIRNGEAYTVTAPVFVEGRDALTLRALTLADSGEADAPFAVCAAVENTGEKELADVTVDFYLSGEDGFSLPLLTPMESEQIGTLRAGETRTVCRRFPAIAGKHRVSAVVRGSAGKQHFADTGYTYLPRAIISRICPYTNAEKGEENPFSFVELYNPFSEALSLDGYALHPCHATGTGCKAEDVQPLDGYTIPAHGTLVIWCQKDTSALENSDFNTRYGTSLGENALFCSRKKLLQYDHRGHKLDLCQNGVPVARVCYGTYCGGTVPACDEQLTYRFAADITVQEEGFTPAERTPVGIPCAEQALPLMSAPSRADEWKNAQEAWKNAPAVQDKPAKKMSLWQTAAFAANAFSTFKEIFSDKD